MTSTLIATPTAPRERNNPPGHSLILEPPEGPDSTLACTCGSLLVLKPATQPAQKIAFGLHLDEVRCESHD
ncbi:hypothetical protein LRE75_33190 [Streptomyces sp. 372A]